MSSNDQLKELAAKEYEIKYLSDVKMKDYTEKVMERSEGASLLQHHIKSQAF
jgi:hypothetical protein